MKVNIVNNYDSNDYSNLINKVLTTAQNKLQLKDKMINIILVDNAKIQELNKTYREKDYVTDVLTFPDGYLGNLGDVFVSIPKCLEQSTELGHSFERELGFLVVHGYLHSLGYDHHTELEEKEMNALQEAILYKSKLNR